MKAEEFLEETKKGSVKGSMLANLAYEEVAQGKEYGGYRFFYNSFKGLALYWHNLKSNATGYEDVLTTNQALDALRCTRWTGNFWQCVMRRAIHYHLDTAEVSVLILLDPLSAAGSCLVQEALGLSAVE